MKNEAKISAVKLVNGGLKGVEVVYTQAETRNGRSFYNDYKSKRKAPIHSELENTFSWLKGHLLDICNHSLGDERQDALNNLAITSVKFDDKGFVIEGQLNILDGTKVVKLKTPAINEADEYADFIKVKNIIEAIFTETKEYMGGNKIVDDIQLVLKFNEKNKEFDKAAFNRLTKLEQQEMATEILEKMGAIVILNDEMTDDDNVVEMKVEEPAVEPATEEVVETIIEPEPETTKDPEPEPTQIVTMLEDGDFSLNIPIKTPSRSTAKRI